MLISSVIFRVLPPSPWLSWGSDPEDSLCAQSTVHPFRLYCRYTTLRRTALSTLSADLVMVCCEAGGGGAHTPTYSRPIYQQGGGWLGVRLVVCGAYAGTSLPPIPPCTALVISELGTCRRIFFFLGGGGVVVKNDLEQLFV